jgi:hypothetical protein
VPVDVKEFYQNSKGFKDYMCEECADSNGVDDDGYHLDTRTQWQTQMNKNLRSALEYRHAARNEAKYMNSKDTALRRHVIRESGYAYEKKLDIKVSTRHKPSMLDAINQVIRKISR